MAEVARDRMTALERYVRLEAVGLWREGAGAPPREVIVSFGNATLVLTDLAEAPLGHWALAGVRAVRRDGGATVYSMTAGGEETLVIRDRDMIEAIAAVSRADRLPPPAPPRSRRRPPAAVLVLLAAAAAAALLGPGLVRAQAARTLPPERAEEFGDRMLIALVAARGPACAGPAGQRALDRIAARLAPDRPPTLRVLDLDGVPVAALPGGAVLLDRAAVAAAPDDVAGLIAIALGRDPAAALMRAAGTAAILGYLVTGDLDEAAIARAAAAAPAPPARAERAAAPAAPPLSGRDRAVLRTICG